MPDDITQRRPLKMPNPYQTDHDYIRAALRQHHREIGELQAEISELRALLLSHFTRGAG